jgi:hypothetical protein
LGWGTLFLAGWLSAKTETSPSRFTPCSLRRARDDPADHARGRRRRRRHTTHSRLTRNVTDQPAAGQAESRRPTPTPTQRKRTPPHPLSRSPRSSSSLQFLSTPTRVNQPNPRSLARRVLITLRLLILRRSRPKTLRPPSRTVPVSSPSFRPLSPLSRSL